MCSRSQYFHCISKRNWVRSQPRICKAMKFCKLPFQETGVLYRLTDLFPLEKRDFSHLHFRSLLPLLTDIHIQHISQVPKSFSDQDPMQPHCEPVTRCAQTLTDDQKLVSFLAVTLAEQLYNSITRDDKDEANCYVFVKQWARLLPGCISTRSVRGSWSVSWWLAGNHLCLWPCFQRCMALCESATNFQVLDSPARGHARLPAGSQALPSPQLLARMPMAHKGAEVPKLASRAMKLHQLPLKPLSCLQGLLRVQEEQATTGSPHMVKTYTALHNLCDQTQTSGPSSPAGCAPRCTCITIPLGSAEHKARSSPASLCPRAAQGIPCG